MKKAIFDYSIDADEETQRQFRECYSQEFVHAALTNPENDAIKNTENTNMKIALTPLLTID